MPPISPSGQLLVSVTTQAAESGKHGAMQITRATLSRPDGTSTALTPTSTIMREEANATSTPWTGGVVSTPSVTTGTGGKAAYSITVGTTTGLSAGQYVRSTAAGLTGVYQVDAISSGTVLRVFAAPGELDIASGATIERVTPETWYSSTVPVDYDDLQGQVCELKVEIDGLTSASRTSTYPVFTTAVNSRKLETLWPEPFQVTTV